MYCTTASDWLTDCTSSLNILSTSQLQTIDHEVLAAIDSALLAPSQLFCLDNTLSQAVLGQPVLDQSALIQPVLDQPVTSKNRSRKRLRNEYKWKRNVRKRLKNLGKEYITVSGKVVSERHMGAGCTGNCRRKCHETFSCENRKAIFDQFWNVGQVDQQRQFIADRVQQMPAKRKTIVNVRSRQFSYVYYLYLEERQTPVCKKFFFGYAWY